MRWLAPLALMGCSLGPNPTLCVEDQECRDHFGLGATCQADGFCAPLSVPDRCLETSPGDVFDRPEKYGSDHVIGALFDLESDQPQARSAQLAVEQVIDAGGLEGADFVLVSCTYQENLDFDDLDREGAVVELLAYLTDDLGASAIVGPSSSDLSLAAYAEAAPRDVLVISPSATSPVLTTVDGEGHDDQDPGLFWRTVPPDDVQGAVMAWDIDNRGVAEVAVVHSDGSYASALADVFESWTQANVARFDFDNETTRSEAITDAGNAGVQEVVFLSSDVNDIIEFLNAAAIGPDFNGPDPVEIFLADAGADPYLLQNTQDLAGVLYHRVRGTRPKVPDGDVFEQFQTAYSGKWGEDPSDAVFAPYTYDAAWLVLYGHAWSLFQEGAIGGTGIARGMRQVSAVGADVVPVRASSWEDVVASFRDGTAVDLEGASGALQFDPITGETLTPIEVWVIDQAGEGFEPVASCEALESGLECTDLTATTTTP